MKKIWNIIELSYLDIAICETLKCDSFFLETKLKLPFKPAKWSYTETEHKLQNRT